MKNIINLSNELYEFKKIWIIWKNKDNNKKYEENIN